jgi:hypothetical protein
MECPLATRDREIRTQEFVSRLPVPEHFATIERRSRRKRIGMVQLERHTHRQPHAGISTRSTLHRSVDREPPRRCRVTGEIDQCDVLVLPGRFGGEPERVWLSVLVEQLDRVNIKPQCVNVS